MELTAFSVTLASKLFDKAFDLGVTKLSKDSLNKKFKKAVSESIEKFKNMYPDVPIKSLQVFFFQEEIFNELQKILFKYSNINIQFIKQNLNVLSIPIEAVEKFIFILREELYKDIEFEEIFSNKELFVTILKLGHSIEEIKEYASLSYNELVKISSTLEKKYNENFDLDTFMDKYKTTVLTNIKQINYFGLGIDNNISKGRKNLDEIYIEPIFNLRKNNSLETCNITDLLNFKKNIVVLGNPGSGKSLFTKYIIYNFLKEGTYLKNTEFYKEIPIRVELKKYVSYKEKNRNIKNYILDLLKTTYGLENITEKNVEYFICNNYISLFFDGLDEIFDVNLREEIKKEIEIISINHPNLKIIVTSRIVGYDETIFNEEIFEKVEIIEFNNKQIRDYVKKWYDIEEKDDDIRKKEILEFFNQKKTIDITLLKNPLLLSLIVILFRNNGEIPESRLEIYRSCTKTLVHKWDENKKLKIDLDSKLLQKKENIFANLAYWQYKRLSNQGKHSDIKYIQVLREVSRIILELKITDDEIYADDLSDRFLEYSKNRSIYFENNFTHKTFLEYYAALWIHRYCAVKPSKQEELKDIFLNYALSSYWFIVLELLLNMMDEQQGDCEVLDDLLENIIDKNEKYLIFLLKVVPLIHNISDCLIKRIYFMALTQIIKEAYSSEDQNKNFFKLFNAIIESNLTPRCINILQTALDDLFPKLTSNQEKTNYHIFYYEFNQSLNDNLKIENKYIEDIQNHLDCNVLYIHTTHFIEGEINEQLCDKYIEKFGRKSMFEDFSFFYKHTTYFYPLIFRLLSNVFKNNFDYERLKRIFSKYEITKQEIGNRIHRTILLMTMGEEQLKKLKSEILEYKKIETDDALKHYIELAFKNIKGREEMFKLKRFG